MNIAVLAYLLLAVMLIVKGAQLEQQALADPVGFLVMIGTLGGLAAGAWLRTAVLARSEQPALTFEDREPPAILALDLHRDGTPPVMSH